MSEIILITGGARSGKSRYALDVAMKYKNRAFIATAVSTDKEMEKRIFAHKKERGDTFSTVEEQIDLARAVNSLPNNTDVALIDCLTVWLGNLVYKYGYINDTFTEIEHFLNILKEPPCNLIIVTNEVGMGIIPENAMARQYRDIAGIINRKTATIADKVIFMVSGINVVIK